MPLFWAAGIATVGTLGSALIGSNAASDASKATAVASQQASEATLQASKLSLAEQAREFNTSQANLQPWLTTGNSALTKLAGLYGLDSYQLNAPGTPQAQQAQQQQQQQAQSAQAQAEKDALAKIRSGLVAWDAANPHSDNGIIKKIDSGASLSDISAALNSLRATTTNSRNTAFLDPVIQTAKDTLSGSGAGGLPTVPLNQANPQIGSPTGTFIPGSGGNTSTDPNATFYQSPDYQFRLSQGIKGLDAGAAARGGLDSGATRKAEIAYAGNLASGEYSNYANRLAALAGVGQTTADNLGSLGAGYANSVGNIATGTGRTLAGIATNQGDSLASSYLAKGQSYGNAIGSIAGIGSGLIQNFATPSYTNAGGGTYNGGYLAPFNSSAAAAGY